MSYKYSIINYLKIWRNFLISYLSIIFVFAVLTDQNSSVIWSFSTLLLASIIGLKTFSYLFLKNIGFGTFKIILYAFIFKILFSTWHFLCFVQPNYFNGNTSYVFFYDYYWMHESIQFLSDEAKKVGFLNSLTFDYFIENKGALIFYIYSPIYYFGGDLVLNLSIVNTVFTLYTAVLVTFMAKSFFNLSKNQLYATLLLCSFFPFGLITSMTMRDFAGQFFIALGLISLQFSFKNSKLFFLLFFSAFLFFLQRKNYILVPILCYLIFLLFYAKQSKLEKYNNNYNFKFLLLILSLIIGYNYYQLLVQSELIDLDSQLNTSYTTDLTTIQFYLLFPVYLIKGFLGPFPWTQFFSFKQETIYQLSDYFTSTFIYAILFALTRMKVKFVELKKEINIITIASLMLSLMGIASGFMHLGYISISVVFLIPFVMKHVKLNFFIHNYIIVFLILVVLSLFWVGFGFSGQGNWSNFRN